MNHSFLAPSAASRWGAPDGCPGSLKMGQAAPPRQRDQTAAREGTAAHEAAEALINGSTHPDKLVGKTASNGVAITAEMVQAAQVMADAVRARRIDAGGVAAHTEERVEIPSIHPDCFGTVDCWFYDANTATLEVWDFKYGFRPVEAEENWQLICYAYGLLASHPYAQFVSLNIVQPRAYGGNEPKRWGVPADEIQRRGDILAQNARLALSDAPPTRSGSHCRYCDALAVCPTARNAGLTMFEVCSTNFVDDPTPDTVGFYLDIISRASEQIEILKSALEAHAEGLIRKGTPVPGWSVRPGRGSEKWTASVDEVVAMGKLLGVDVSKPGVLTPKQARAAGLSEAVVATLSKTEPGAVKLSKTDKTKAKNKFS